MKISIIGLGYVGLVSAIGFSKLEHKVIGVDIDKEKVEKIKNGINPLEGVEGLEGYIDKYPFEIYSGNPRRAISKSEISFVCVETPSRKNGSLNLNPLKKACRDIGKSIKRKEDHIIVIRSTMFPGSLNVLREEIERYSGKKEGGGFSLLTNPEFLREKYAIEDFFDPCYIVVGADNQDIGEKVIDCYKDITTKKFIVDNDVAQMIKYVNNSWHGCKVAFTNEIGNICKNLGIDGNKVMSLFVEDKKLNVSPYYHKIGDPFGGHCLPKELSVLQDNSKNLGLKSYLINAISKSNDDQKNYNRNPNI